MAALDFSRGLQLGQAFKSGRTRNRLDDLAQGKERQTALFQDVRNVRTRLQGGDIDGANRVIDERIGLIQQFGGDPSDTLEIKNRLSSGDIQGAMSLLETVEGVGIGAGLLSDPLDRQIKEARLASLTPGADRPKSVQSAQIFDDGTVLSVLKGGGRQVTNTLGEVVTGTSAKDAIKQARTSEIETRAKIESLKQETTLLNARAKGIVAAEGKTIEDGLFAAKGLPTLFRIETLLDIQDTGSPEQLKLWAKKKFGVESANEVELNNLLSKKVLQQIKPLFGAAPSQAEGQWLRDIEATYGTSTEGNRVLVQRGISLANERVRQGVEAATARGDTRTVKNLKDWQNFRIDSPLVQSQQGAGAGSSASSDAELKARLGI